MKIVTALLMTSALMTVGQAAAQGTAATLQDMNGKVLMNKGSGLVSGRAGTALVDGDRIVTLDKSGARVVFPDGCGVTLQENMIFVVNSELGCKALPVASNPPPAAPAALAATTGLTTTQGLIIGGIVVLGAAIMIGPGGSDTTPISSQ